MGSNKVTVPIPQKREINWAKYLDFTLFIKSGEIGNDDLKEYQNDLLP